MNVFICYFPLIGLRRKNILPWLINYVGTHFEIYLQKATTFSPSLLQEEVLRGFRTH